MKVLTHNRAKCKKCKQIIESKHVHDYVTCKCGNVSVDGGLEYAKRSFKFDGCYEELSEYKEVPDKEPIKENLTLSVLRRKAIMEPVNIAYLCNRYREALQRIAQPKEANGKYFLNRTNCEEIAKEALNNE